MSALAEKIHNCLTKHSPCVGAHWVAHNAPSDTLHDVNRYLRLQLGLLEDSTTAARECLLDDISEKDWLRLFNKHVAPVVARCGLPAWN